MHQLDDSTKLEISTSALSTLEHLHLWSHKSLTVIRLFAHLKTKPHAKTHLQVRIYLNVKLPIAYIIEALLSRTMQHVILDELREDLYGIVGGTFRCI